MDAASVKIQLKTAARRLARTVRHLSRIERFFAGTILVAIARPPRRSGGK